MRSPICAAPLAAAALLSLSACLSGSPVTNLTSPPAAETETPQETSWKIVYENDRPALPELRAQDVGSAPISYRGIDGGTLLVGNDLTPRYPLRRLERDGRPNLFFGSRHGRVHYSKIVDYLSEVSPGALNTFSAPPTVHIAAGTKHRQNVLRAVQWINEALPPAWHIRIGRDIAPLRRWVPNGAIYVDVFPSSRIGHKLGTEHAAGTAHLDDNRDGSRRSAHVFVAPDKMGWSDDPYEIVESNIVMDKVIIHELLHALGFEGHVEGQGLGSRLMRKMIGRTDPTDMLYPIDRQALFAAYMKLEPGDSHEEINDTLFGNWPTLVDYFVLRTDLYEAGVSRQFVFEGDEPSHLQAWASGPTPSTNLEDSPLSGTITWNGELIGFRPGYHLELGQPFSTVTGDAEIGVELSTLEGHAHFDDLKSHGTTIPGTGGVTRRWGDGDLEYDIEVRGNTFRQIGGDEGMVTGIFTGEEHEGAAGTLERDDLSAAFGATREIGEDPELPVVELPPSSLLLSDTGSYAATGMERYDEYSIEHLGRFEGRRTTWSYTAWGLWGENDGQPLFVATISGTNIPDRLDLTLLNPYYLAVYGTPSYDNPEGYGTAVWNGKVRAYETHPDTFGTPVEGTARLEMDLDGLLDTIDVDFTSFDRGHRDMSWNSVFVSLGRFRSFLYGDLEGEFYGDEHEGVAGKFERDSLKGVFGAMREE